MGTRRKTSVLWKIGFMCIFIYLFVTSLKLWGTFFEDQTELEDLYLQAEVKKTEIEEFKELLDSNSRKYLIERAARERLGYVYSDEQIFIDISGN